MRVILIVAAAIVVFVVVGIVVVVVVVVVDAAVVLVVYGRLKRLASKHLKYYGNRIHTQSRKTNVSWRACFLHFTFGWGPVMFAV